MPVRVKEKTIEEKYQHLDEISHILKRPGMYIGSIKNEPKSFFLYNPETELLELREIEYVPGLLKLVDEPLSNSCDEFRRESNMGLTDITVKIDTNATLTIRDSGGVPVVMHKTSGKMLPDFIFGELRTSSNYDDNEARDVVGTNGIGSKISGIFSKSFSIFTADSKKSFYHSWSENMRKANDDTEIKKCKEHFTESRYVFDLERFENITELSDDFIDLIEKRCIDAAAANLGLKVKFRHMDNGELVRESEWKFDSFDDYIALYGNYIDTTSCIYWGDSSKKIYFFPDGNINIGFVNGAECSQGTHIKAIHTTINESVANYINTKKKLEVTPKIIDNKYSTFSLCTVYNPTYDSQSKTCLTNQLKEFDISKKFTDAICKSDLVEAVIDYYKQQEEISNIKELKKINKDAKKKLLRSDKYIPANGKIGKKLWIFEGDSAQAGFRVARDPQVDAAYLLRGCPLNCSGLSISKIMSNKEFADLVSIIGLQWGQTNRPEDLNFDKIYICSDMDPDGGKICALLLVFFSRFPELFESGMICRAISPLMIATKKNGEEICIYDWKEYEERFDELKGLEIKYLKGLASLNAKHYSQLIKNPILHVFKYDDLSESTLERWFGRGLAKERKQNMKINI